MAEAWRTAPLPPDWHITQPRILARDAHRCRTCGKRATTVDHVIPTHLGGCEHDHNLQALCAPCHASKTGREAQARRPRRRRDPEPHPGLRHAPSPGVGGCPPPPRDGERRG
jgi:5-methylcytosine-specific restriction protein A